MSQCKFCSSEVVFLKNELGKWETLNPNSTRHSCKTFTSKAKEIKPITTNTNARAHTQDMELGGTKVETVTNSKPLTFADRDARISDSFERKWKQGEEYIKKLDANTTALLSVAVELSDMRKTLGAMNIILDKLGDKINASG